MKPTKLNDDMTLIETTPQEDWLIEDWWPAREFAVLRAIVVDLLLDMMVGAHSGMVGKRAEHHPFNQHERDIRRLKNSQALKDYQRLKKAESEEALDVHRANALLRLAQRLDIREHTSEYTEEE